MAGVDVIIVGAGISGLTAAYELSKTASDLKLLILEASELIGGRCKSVSLKCTKGTDRWDIGKTSKIAGLCKVLQYVQTDFDF